MFLSERTGGAWAYQEGTRVPAKAGGRAGLVEGLPCTADGAHSGELSGGGSSSHRTVGVEMFFTH